MGGCSGKRDEIRLFRKTGRRDVLPACRAREPEKAGDKYAEKRGDWAALTPQKTSAGEKIYFFRKEKTLHFQSDRVIIN